jgi:hypothetical protein
MITNNEFASRVINSLRYISKDMHISRRFVIAIGNIKAKFLMTQKLDEMTLFREEGIICNIACFKLKPDNLKSCDVFEFRSSKNIMKSCKKLPEGLYGKNGVGIINVTNVDGSKMYHYVTPRQYSNNLFRTRNKRSRVGYYYVKDGYLYLPDSSNELVEISMFTLNKWEAEEACECNSKSSGCKSRLDYEFVCPDRLLDMVIRDTLQELASIYRTTPVDENPNLDENQKSQTVA